MKREAINHTKMRRLARTLGVQMWGARGIMESVWSLTRDEAPAGNIGKLSNADIADFVGWDTNSEVLIDGLVTSGWLDRSQIYRLLVHDWADHCEDYVHSRLAVAGLLFANGAVPKTRKLNQDQRKSINPNPLMPSADPSAPVAATHADQSAPVAAENAEPYLTLPNLTQPNQTHHAADAAFVSARTELDKLAPPGAKPSKAKRSSEEIKQGMGAERLTWWENFWRVYPCHNSMREGLEAFDRIVTTRELALDVYRGAQRYAAFAAAQPGMKFKYAQGWLNGERWKDECVPPKPVLTIHQERNRQTHEFGELMEKMRNSG